MLCSHFLEIKEVVQLKKEEKRKKCTCGKLTEWYCFTCHEALCEECRDSHKHPITVGTPHGWCSTCKKIIDIADVQVFWDSLPPFLPCNEKGIGLFLKHRTPKKIIIMAGAGISTSAGIPDFRTPGPWMTDLLTRFNLPYPELASTLDYFDEHPEPFYYRSSHMMPGLGKFFPTTTHYFSRFLVEKGLVQMYYTQNIDGLEHLSGIPMEKLVLAHGHFYTGHCRKCNKEFPQSYYIEHVRKAEICHCECGGVIKPDIVFFGEQLPQKFFDNLKMFSKCDFLLVMGTSLVVQPFASLVDRVHDYVPRVFINLTNVSDFERSADCKVLKKTDEACMTIADYWGVGDEFRAFLAEKKEEVENGNSK